MGCAAAKRTYDIPIAISIARPSRPDSARCSAVRAALSIARVIRAYPSSTTAAISAALSSKCRYTALGDTPSARAASRRLSAPAPSASIVLSACRHSAFRRSP
ncbi:MAG: hypothetical protein R3F14_13290 [Polyangiaceae bacterium]